MAGAQEHTRQPDQGSGAAETAVPEVAVQVAFIPGKALPVRGIAVPPTVRAAGVQDGPPAQPQDEVVPRVARVGSISRLRRAARALADAPSETTDDNADGRSHIRLSVDGADMELSHEDALEVLRRLCRRVEAGIAGDRAGLESLQEAHKDQPVIAAISDYMGGGGLFGSLHLPEANVWDEADGLLKRAQAAIVERDMTGAASLIQLASDKFAVAHAKLAAYREGTIGGAEHAVTGLRALEVAGAIAATTATGGAASAAGLGLLGTSGAIGGIAGLYGASQTEAEQTGEMVAGTRQWGMFDPVAILERGGTDAVVGFVGAFAGGKLAESAVRAFGKAAMAAMGPEQLEAVARAANVEVSALRPEIFVGPLRRFVIDMFSGAATTPLTTAVQVTLAHLTGEDFPKSPDQFAEMVIQNAVQGGLIQIFVGGLTHGLTTAGLKTGFEPIGRGAVGDHAPEPIGSAGPKDSAQEAPAGGGSQAPTTSGSSSTPVGSEPSAGGTGATTAEQVGKEVAKTGHQTSLGGDGPDQPPATSKAATGSAKAAKGPTKAPKPPGPVSKGPAAGEVTFENIEKVPGMKATIKRLEMYMEKGGGSWAKLGFNDPQKFLEFVNRDPDAAVTHLNRSLDIANVHAEDVGSAREKVDGPHTVEDAPRKWDRREVLGNTPNKDSRTGQTVRQRMTAEQKIKTENGKEIFFDRRTKKWHPVNSRDTHMGHTEDAVTWWNEKGRFFNPRSAEVRAWMENAANYELEYGPENSAAGARIREEYLPPVGPGIDTSSWENPYRGHG